MAIILPHGVLFRGGVEERIRTKLQKDGHIDTVVGLPANLNISRYVSTAMTKRKSTCRQPTASLCESRTTSAS